MVELELALREAQKRLQTDNSNVDFSEELKKELALLLPQLQIQKEPQAEPTQGNTELKISSKAAQKASLAKNNEPQLTELQQLQKRALILLIERLETIR